MLCVAQPAAAQAMFPLLGFIKEEQVRGHAGQRSSAAGTSLGSRCLLTPSAPDLQASGPSVVHSSYQAANNAAAAAAAASAGLSQQWIQLEQSQLYAGLQAVSLAPGSQGMACAYAAYACNEAAVPAWAPQAAACGVPSTLLLLFGCAASINEWACCACAIRFSLHAAAAAGSLVVLL
jgi:hypothetical protein